MSNELIKQIGQAMIDDPESGFKQFDYSINGDKRVTAWSWNELLACGPTRQVRRKPKTITYTVTIPEPYRGDLSMGEKYFVANPTIEKWFTACYWEESYILRRCMEFGLVYLTKEDAIAAAKAMAGVNDG